MRVLPLLLASLALVACNRPEPSSNAAQAATAPAAPVQTDDAPAFDPDCAFCANPDFVRTCDVASGVRTTLHWKADPALPNVGIFVVDDAGNDSSFAEQPPSGSIQTGPWLKPGLTFKLKDPDGNLLQTLVIAGKDC